MVAQGLLVAHTPAWQESPSAHAPVWLVLVHKLAFGTQVPSRHESSLELQTPVLLVGAQKSVLSTHCPWPHCCPLGQVPSGTASEHAALLPMRGNFLVVPKPLRAARGEHDDGERGGREDQTHVVSLIRRR